MDLERGALAQNPKHPLAEPLIVAYAWLLRAAGHAGPLLRPLQLWNAGWTLLALLLVQRRAMAGGLSARLATVLPLLLGGTYAGLHFLTDPFLYYWPPSLALLSLTFDSLAIGAAERPSVRGLALAALAGGAATAINPFVSGAVLALFVSRAWTCRNTSRRALATLALGPLSLAPLALFAWRWGRGELRGMIDARLAFGDHDRAQRSWHGLLECLATFRGQFLDPKLELTRTAALLAVALACLTLVAARRVRWALAGPLLVAGGAHVLLLGWWDPEQPFFWVLLPWLFVSALPGSTPRLGERAARLSEQTVLVAVALLWLHNAASYLLPSARRAGSSEEMAEKARRFFGEKDLLVFAVWGEYNFDYFAQRSSTGWLALTYQLEPGQRLFDHFATLLADVRAGGGEVYVETDLDGIPILAAELAYARGAVTRAELDRLVLGLGFRVGRHRLHRVLGITSEPPCQSARLQKPSPSGLRAWASDYVERSTSESYSPGRAVDGDAQTEWLVPDQEVAWLDLAFDAREVRGLEILPAENRPHGDYGSLRARAELSRDGERVATGEAELTRGRPTEVVVRAGAADCVRLFVVRSRGRGGGFAEVGVR